MTEEQITTETLETCRQKADEFLASIKRFERSAQGAYSRGSEQLAHALYMLAAAEAEERGFALTIHANKRSLWFELHWPEAKG